MNLIGAKIDNCVNSDLDLYTQMRSEDRFLINILSGLDKLNIKSHALNQNCYQNRFLTNNILLTSGFDNHYNNIIFFSNWDKYEKYSSDKFLFMTHNYGYYEFFKNKFSNIRNSEFCTPMLSCFKLFKSKNINIKFLPTVFPIPEYHLGFKDFNYTNKKNIKIYIQIYIRIEQYPDWCKSLIYQIGNSLFDNGYNVEFILHTKFQNNYQDDTKFKKSFITNLINYKELYNIIESCDFGVVFGDGGSASGSQFDFISLGKPIMYLSNGDAKDNDFVSPFYYRKDLMFFYCYNNINYLKLNEFINSFMSNIQQYYNGLKETMLYYDFYNWKNYIEFLL